MIRTLFFTILLSIITIFSTRAEQYLFTKLSNRNWSMSTTNYIYKGSDKYIWVATTKGVYRYDGYEYKRYTYNHEANGISGTAVYRLFKDSIGHFWILTDKGIGLYDRKTDSFQQIKDSIIAQQPLYSFCLDHDGVYLGSQDRMYKYTYATQSFSVFKECDPKENILFDNLYMIPGHRILFNNGSRLGTLNLDTRSINPSFLSFPAIISSLYVDSHSRIWVSSYNQGLTCYDITGKEMGRYTTTNSSLSCDAILCMAEQDSALWMGTEGGGINILHPDTNDFEVIRHSIGDDKSLPSNSINYLSPDGSNSMWAGSIRDGVFSIRKSDIKTYTETYIGSHNGLSNSTILHLLEDNASGCVWIGTDGEGVNRMDLATHRFTHYPSTLKMKVVSIAHYSDTELILSVYLKGLYVFNKATGSLRPVPTNNSQIEASLLYTGTVIHLFNETRDQLLISGYNMYRYNLRTHRSEAIRFRNGNGADGFLYPIAQDTAYTYFYDKHSIYRLGLNNNELETAFTLPSPIQINSVSLDSDGNFWLGTNKGLSYYSPTQQKYNNIPTTLFSDVMLVIPDNRGKVWIGANDNLYAYQIKENSFAFFGESDGALPNEYIKKSRLLTSRGDVLMGGNRGLLTIGNTFTVEASDTPQIQLTEVSVNKKQVAGITDGQDHTIEIPSENSILELKVMAVEKDLLRSKIYRYEITGANHLQLESYSPRLTLTSLLPGTNTISVSCSTRQGEWTPPVRLLTIDVLPPWHDALWFKLSTLGLAIILSALIFYSIFHLKESKLKMQMQKHEKDIYEEKVRFLININHELRTPLTLIHDPLKRILREMSPSEPYFTRLGKIYRQSSRMKKLLNMVLDLRKMEVGEKKMDIASYPVNDWISSVISDFTDEGEAIGVSLATSFDPRITTINFDKEKCDIILTNMLVNAIKHSQEGGTILVSTQITGDGMIRISVCDQGTGFTDIDPNKLFTRYYQGNNEKYGSGIGLAYSKVLVELHKGKIGAFNNSDRGATFFFELPADLPSGKAQCEAKPYLNHLFTPEEQAIQLPYDKGNEHFDTTPYTILIVDDSFELTDFLSETFSNKFKQVLVAANGEEALKIVRKEQPNIVVSDVMMPLMDGYELCREIKTNIEFSHIPVILLTAQNEEQSEQTGYKLGADAFLSKPFDTDTLYELISNKLKSREDIKKRYMQMSILPEPQKDTISQTDEVFLQKLNDIIKENISNTELDISLLCNSIGMSRASLYNKIKALTDMSGNEYINKIKMEQAIQLIQDTNMSFTQIASETGFASLKYFSSAFKLYTGMTPTQFKKEKRAAREEEKEKA